MATLVVVRHGEAEGNYSHRFIGQSQMQLTDEGHRQAEVLAARLSSLPVTRLVSSDLLRSTATLEPLSRVAGLAVETDSRLREIDNGEWTGLLPEEIRQGWPEMWADYVAGMDVPRPGGERWIDVARRVIPVAEELVSGDGTVVVASHGGPVLILAMWASGISIEGNIFRGRLASLGNASVTMIEPGPRLLTFNDVGHLMASPDQRLPFEEVES